MFEEQQATKEVEMLAHKYASEIPITLARIG